MSIRNPAPNAAQAAIIARLKEQFADLEAQVCRDIANNRERSLALTNLEQASMWATKAVLEDQRHKELTA